MHATTEAIEDLRALLKNTATELVNAKAKIRQIETELAAVINERKFDPAICECPKGHHFRTTPNTPAKSEREWECPHCAVIDRDQLKRELAAVTAERDEAKKEISQWRTETHDGYTLSPADWNQRLTAELTLATAELKELRARESAISDARLEAFKRIMGEQVHEAQRQVEASDKLNREFLAKNRQLREALETAVDLASKGDKRWNHESDDARLVECSKALSTPEPVVK